MPRFGLEIVKKQSERVINHGVEIRCYPETNKVSEKLQEELTQLMNFIGFYVVKSNGLGNYTMEYEFQLPLLYPDAVLERLKVPHIDESEKQDNVLNLRMTANNGELVIDEYCYLIRLGDCNEVDHLFKPSRHATIKMLKRNIVVNVNYHSSPICLTVEYFNE